MTKDYRDYIHDILDSLNDIDDFVQGYSFEDLLKDKKTINAGSEVWKSWVKLPRIFPNH